MRQGTFLFLLTVTTAMLALTVWTWWQSAQPTMLGYEALPAGQTAYLLSKLAGLISVLLLWWQCILAVAFPPRHAAWHLKVHRVSAVLFLMAILVHYSLFVIAVDARQGHFPLALLGPQLGNYFKVAVTVGWTAFVGLFLVFLAGILRRYLKKAWKYLHRLAFGFAVMALLHGFMIGSETASGEYGVWFAGMAGTLIAAILDRLISASASKSNMSRVQPEAEGAP